MKTISRKTNLSIALGTTFAWYDFMIFNIATALIFPQLFFTDMGYLIPMLVFAVGFLCRPIGSLIFGSIGDRFGRKKSLIYTLYITGLSTVLIGLLPTYQDVGIAATILLIMARILQTAGFGGEWAAACVMILEHNAQSKNKSLLAGIISMGWPIGTIMASGMFMLVTSFGSEFFIQYGWRIPFLLSVFLLMIGVYVRHRLIETPEFESILKNQPTSAYRFGEFFKNYKHNVLAGALAIQMSAAWAFIILIFGFNYLLQNGLSTRSELTQIQFYMTWLNLLAIVFWAWLGDKIGVRTVLYIGICASLLLTGPIFLWLAQGDIFLVYLCLIFVNCPALAVAPKMLGELFPTQYRQTGVGITYNLNAALGAGLVPILAQKIIEFTDSLYFVAMLLLGCTILSLIGTWLLTRKQLHV